MELIVKKVQNNCEIIRRLADGNLDEKEMGEIGESLATGRTLGEIRAGHVFGNTFTDLFGSGFTQSR